MKQVMAIAAAFGVSVSGGADSYGGQAAGAKKHQVAAAMTPTQVVTPTNKKWGAHHRPPSKAKGTLVATLDTQKRTLTWKITYSRIGSSPLVIADVAHRQARSAPARAPSACATSASRDRVVSKKLKAVDPGEVPYRRTLDDDHHRAVPVRRRAGPDQGR